MNSRPPSAVLARTGLAAALFAGACGRSEVASIFAKEVCVRAADGAVITVTAAEASPLAGTRLEIPPGALAQDTCVTLRQQSHDLVDPPARPAGPTLVWGPAGVPLTPGATLTLPVQRPPGTDSSQLVLVTQAADGSTRAVQLPAAVAGEGVATTSIVALARFQPAVVDCADPTAVAPAGACPAEIRVFPGAEGFGSTTPAGRGGRLLRVTTLADAGPGSLREALTTNEPRVVVFEVGGAIALASDIWIEAPFVTLAGQSAPPPGIEIRYAALRVATHDVLIQHLRLRPGDDGSTGDTSQRVGLSVKNGAFNVVIDHNTAQWGTHDNAEIWASTAGVSDVTFSHNLFAEGLPPGSRGLQLGTEGYPVERISIIANLFVHHGEASPSIAGSTAAFVANNLAYNSRYEFTVIGFDGAARATLVGNHYVTGSAQGGAPVIAVSAQGVGSAVYLADNLVTGGSPTLFVDLAGGCLVATPPINDSSVRIRAAADVRAAVVPSAGAWPARRDFHEQRVIDDVLAGTGGLKTGLADAGGRGAEYDTPTGSPFLIDDPDGDDDSDGYTNLEERLHALAASVEGR